MNCNLKNARPRAPKEWERLPDRDKHIIIQYLKEKVMEELEQTLIPDLVRINLDHEEAELQKVWLQIMCIAEHDTHGHGRLRNLYTLRRFKTLYAKIERMKSKEERDEWLRAENQKIFGKGGYPYEWVDSLENRGKSI